MKITVHKREEAQNLADNGKYKNIKLLVMGFFFSVAGNVFWGVFGSS